MKNFYSVLFLVFSFQLKSESLIDSLFVRTWNANLGIYENGQFLKRFIDASCARVDSYSLYLYSVPQSQWNLEFTFIRTFNLSNQKTEELIFKGTQRFNFGKILFNYQGGLLTDSIEQLWSAQSSKYINDRRTIIKRMPDTRPDTVITQIWNSGTAQWDNFRREVISYVSGGAIYEITSVLQDWGNNQWVNSRREISAFDFSNNNILDKTSQVWNSDSLKWLNNDRVTYSYNLQGRTSELLRETYSQNNTWVNSSRSIFSYSGAAVEVVSELFDMGTASWNKFLKINFVEPCGSILAIKNAASFKVNVYPNPVSDLVHVQSEEPCSFSLTDLYGKVLLQTDDTTKTHCVDISGLARAVYLLELNSNNQKQIHKIVKR